MPASYISEILIVLPLKEEEVLRTTYVEKPSCTHAPTTPFCPKCGKKNRPFLAKKISVPDYLSEFVCDTDEDTGDLLGADGEVILTAYDFVEYTGRYERPLPGTKHGTKVSLRYNPLNEAAPTPQFPFALVVVITKLTSHGESLVAEPFKLDHEAYQALVDFACENNLGEGRGIIHCHCLACE